MTTYLESRIRQIEDRTQISEQVIRYAMGVDRRDWAMFASCFTDPVYADFSGGGTTCSARRTAGGSSASSSAAAGSTETPVPSPKPSPAPGADICLTRSPTTLLAACRLA